MFFSQEAHELPVIGFLEKKASSTFKLLFCLNAFISSSKVASFAES
jgi:hypothetical protein